MSWNRRKFVGVMGFALGGLSGTGLVGAVEPVRKMVTIAGKLATVIDIHAHCVVPEVPLTQSRLED